MAIENANTIDERRSKIVRNIVFDCHLSTDWRQMAIKNTVYIDFDPLSMNVKRGFDCCIYTLFNEGKTHLAKIKLFYHVALHIKIYSHDISKMIKPILP